MLDGLGLVSTEAVPTRGCAVDGVLGGLPSPEGELGKAPVRPTVYELGQHVSEPSFRVQIVHANVLHAMSWVGLGLVTAKLYVLAIYDQCQRLSDLRARSG